MKHEKHIEACGGAGIPDGMLVVRSVDGQAEKLINERYPGIGGIVLIPTEYSAAELEEVRAGINEYIRRDKDAGNTDLWYNGPATSTQDGRLVLEVTLEQYDSLLSYIESLPDKGCLDIRIGEFSSFDD